MQEESDQKEVNPEPVPPPPLVPAVVGEAPGFMVRGPFGSRFDFENPHDHTLSGQA